MNIKFLLLQFLICIFLYGCANQIYPPGGPVDTEPPYIVDVEPKPNTLNYKSNKFHFEFNEYIDRRSFEESVFISPASIEKPKFEWSGKEVDVILPYQLKDNKTYTITIGTDVIDLNNRNRMAESYTLAFSTGDKIDSFYISGKVYDENQPGLLISAYKIDSLNKDTLNPSYIYPDYTTQTGKNGDFVLKNLSEGTYRIFAFKDEYKNLLYDAMIDKAGSYWEDVSLNNQNQFYNDVRIKLKLFDTTSLKLFEAEAKDINHVLLKFNRNINPHSFSLSSISIFDSINFIPLNIKNYYIKGNTTNQIRLYTDSMKEEKYFLKINNIYDSLGLKIDSNYNSYFFVGSKESDTLTPQIISMSIQDSTRGFGILQQIRFEVNDIIDTIAFTNNTKIFDANGNKINYFLENYYNSSFEIYPNNLKYNSWYKLFIPKSALLSTSGRSMNKDSIVINFMTEERSGLTSISGFVSDTNYTIEAKNNIVYRTKANNERKFKFDNIKEGTYRLFLFIDSDSNSVYSYGNIYPYQKPEKFYYFPDTLKVKARWPLEDVNIKIK